MKILRVQNDKSGETACSSIFSTQKAVPSKVHTFAERQIRRSTSLCFMIGLGQENSRTYTILEKIPPKSSGERIAGMTLCPYCNALSHRSYSC